MRECIWHYGDNNNRVTTRGHLLSHTHLRPSHSIIPMVPYFWPRKELDINWQCGRFHWSSNTVYTKSVQHKLHRKFNISLSTDLSEFYLKWNKSVTCLKCKKIKYISLPGKTYHIHLETKFYKNVISKIVWLTDIYCKHKQVLQSMKQVFSHEFSHKFNFTTLYSRWFSEKSNRYYILFRENRILNHQPLYDADTQLRSWLEASELCKSVGGHLPYFTSIEDVEELIALVKPLDRCPLEAIYIGLIFNGSEQV